MDVRIPRLISAARRRAGTLARRDERAASPQQQAPVAAGRGKPVVGMVEQFSRRMIVGWVSVPRRSAPVLVTLHLGPLKIASTYATAGPSMSGTLSALRRGERNAAGGPTSAVSTGAPLVNTWQKPNVPGPRDDRRNSRQEIRTFSFRVHDLWQYLKKENRVTVRVDGLPLPIYGHGMFLRPPKGGKKSLDELRAELADGYLLSQYGRIQLSKKLDVTWQKQVMDLYQEVRLFLAEKFGHDVFFIYGTLLGAVRENGYIGHDVDFDAAYVSRHTSGPEAAQELVDIGLALIEAGFVVDCMRSCLHIHHPDGDPEARIDLFHTYFDAAGKLLFPFGIAGTGSIDRADWKDTLEIDFPGGRGLVPVNAEQVVEHLYGEDWRQPKPGFNWNLDRTANATEGILSTEQRSTVYWANFYARMEYTEGSTFFEFVNARPETPQVVFDIGCGDGRDSCAFGAAGRMVTGLDRSEVGIEHARAHVVEAKVDARVSFEVCDVSDAERLGSLISERFGGGGEPLMFYLRFFLHSIPEDVQEKLMGVIRDLARRGDVFAAEFRTDEDEEKTKVHGKHYRRFQNGSAFGARLADDYGFTILHEETGTGLSPYKGEDPVLYRVIARR